MHVNGPKIQKIYIIKDSFNDIIYDMLYKTYLRSPTMLLAIMDSFRIEFRSNLLSLFPILN